MCFFTGWEETTENLKQKCLIPSTIFWWKQTRLRFTRESFNLSGLKFQRSSCRAGLAVFWDCPKTNSVFHCIRCQSLCRFLQNGKKKLSRWFVIGWCWCVCSSHEANPSRCVSEDGMGAGLSEFKILCKSFSTPDSHFNHRCLYLPTVGHTLISISHLALTLGSELYCLVDHMNPVPSQSASLDAVQCKGHAAWTLHVRKY